MAFWLGALGATPGPTVDEYVAIGDVLAPGGPLDLEVQRIGGDARLHLDISVDDVDAEVARLRTLGATHVASVADWVTLADPVGNLFCVVPS